MFLYLLHREDGENGKDVKAASENLRGWICLILSWFSGCFIHCSCFWWKRVFPHFLLFTFSDNQAMGWEKCISARTLSCKTCATALYYLLLCEDAFSCVRIEPLSESNQCRHLCFFGYCHPSHGIPKISQKYPEISQRYPQHIFGPTWLHLAQRDSTPRKPEILLEILAPLVVDLKVFILVRLACI